MAEYIKLPFTDDIREIENWRKEVTDYINDFENPVISWDDIQNKPTEFNPVSHNHLWNDITDKPTYLEVYNPTGFSQIKIENPTTNESNLRLKNSLGDYAWYVASNGNFKVWNYNSNNHVLEIQNNDSMHHYGRYFMIYGSDPFIQFRNGAGANRSYIQQRDSDDGHLDIYAYNGTTISYTRFYGDAVSGGYNLGSTALRWHTFYGAAGDIYTSGGTLNARYKSVSHSVGAYFGRFQNNADTGSGGSYFAYMSYGGDHIEGANYLTWNVENHYCDFQAYLMNASGQYWLTKRPSTNGTMTADYAMVLSTPTDQNNYLNIYGVTSPYLQFRLQDGTTGSYIRHNANGYMMIVGYNGSAYSSVRILGHLYPYTDNTYPLGASTLRFSALYIGTGAIDTTGQMLMRNEKHGIHRYHHNSGYLVGSYNSVGANSTTSGAIYTIGSGYYPEVATLGTMYGIGYTHTSASFIDFVNQSDGWGMYVASAGVARIWLDGQNGNINLKGHIYLANNNRLYGASTSGDQRPIAFINTNNILYLSSESTQHTAVNTMASGAFMPYVDNRTYLGLSSNRWKAVYSVNGTIQTSDERLKTFSNKNLLGLDFILGLNPMKYKWKNDFNNFEIDPKIHYGFSAQQTEQLLNDLGKNWGGLHYDQELDSYNLNYSEFIAPMVKAIQELNDKIVVLENKLNEREVA